MAIITSPELIINMKSIPTPDSREYNDFVRAELKKLEEGVTINGVYIPNWLYWHISYWKLYRPVWDDRRKEVIDVFDRPLLRDNEWIIAEALMKAKAEQKGIILIGARRLAKELLNSSKLYTDRGEITIGECKVGDKIFGPDGKLTNIIGVHPQGKVPIYKMTLLDGREIFCGLEHNWLVYERAKTKKNKVSKTYSRKVVKTTKELMESGIFRYRKHNGYSDGKTHNVKEYKYWIPNNKPVEYSQNTFDIPPYLLGLWLGDGTNSKPQITTVDPEILEYINNYCQDNDLLVKNYDGKISYSIVKNKAINKNNTFLQSLQLNNLLNNKHIPKNYLYSSIEDRLELLRGLMDTDGSCSKNGVITFSTTTPQLAEDFYFLCRSLGINLTKTKYIPVTTYKGKRVNGKEAIKFTLFTRLPIFKLKRKLSNMKLDNNNMLSRIEKTAIVSIDYVFDDYATCITVDNDDSLYLTDNFTTTHNTSFLASHLGLGATIYEGSQNVIVGNNKNDIKNITSQMDKGLNAVEPFLRYNRIRDDWKNQVDLGFKYKKGGSWVTEEWSQIHIRNTEEGINTEVLAGLTPKTLVFDEIGKAKTKEVFLGSIPAYNSPYGWRCVPILSGTGGDMAKGQDANEMFNNPERYNLLAIDVPNEERKTGIFISGLMSIDVPKDPMPLSKYLNLETPSELDDVTIHVTNEEKGREIIQTNRNNFLKANNQVEYLKAVMYAPLTPDECFMSNEQENPFPVEALKQHLEFLKRGSEKKLVRLYRDVDGKVNYAIDTKRFEIKDFPATKDTDKNAPVVMYEEPMANPPNYLYIAGCLLPGEKVMTDSGLKSVEHVTLKDKLINKEGELVNIKRLIPQIVKKEDTYKIKVSNSYRTTTFTKEHPIYISRPYLKNNNTIDESKFIFDFETADKLNIGDWIKVPNIYKSNKLSNLDKYWNYKNIKSLDNPLYSEEFWWFIGLFLGDGWCESNGHRISVAFNSKETQYIEKFEKVVNNLFNRKINIKDKGSYIECYFSCTQLHNFLCNNFGKYAGIKLIPEWAKRIEDSYKLNLILGYLDSDGCITKHTKGYYSTEFVSINLELLEAIQDICFSLGLISNLSKLRDKSKIIFRNKESYTQKTYHLRLGHNDTVNLCLQLKNFESIKLSKVDLNNLPNFRKKSKGSCFFDKSLNYIYFKIKDIQKDIYTGIVYNFECDTNTFMCRNITTHNCDPYNQNKSEVSPSLGTVTVYKRTYDPVSGTYQNRIVASYAARPETMKEWQETVEMLLELYNAICMIENEGTNFIQYMENKNKLYYLADGYNLAKEINPKTSIQGRVKGLPATVKIQNHYRNLILQYCTEKLVMGQKEDGEPMEAMGLVRIQDEMLLTELINYKPKGNFDRLVAFGHCLIYDEYLQKIAPNVKVKDIYEVPQKKEPQIRSPFILNTRSNPFGI